MPDLNECYNPRQVAAYYGVPVDLIRRITDRLALGTWFHGSRLLFVEGLQTIEIVLRAMGKLAGIRPDKSRPEESRPEEGQELFDQALAQL
jgi:hypothetical protein